MERASRRFWNPLKCRISTWQGRGKGRWQSAGKGLKLRGRVWGPGGTCFAQVLKPSKCRISTWQGRGKGRKVHGRVSCPCETCLAQMQYSTWQSVGKGLKLHGGFWGPGGTCFAQVLKPSKCSISTWQGKGKGRWQSAGKGLKLHGRVWGHEVLKPSINPVFRPGKAAANGERCTGGFPVLVKRAWRRCGNRLNAIFDLAKRWQRAKAAPRVLGPWWNVLRAGFETL